MKALSLPESVYHTGSVPHDWLLGQAAGMVHHGGFGTSAAAFRAGIPALVIPQIFDQFVWGQRAVELGVGPKPIPRTKLNRQGMTEVLSQMVSNSEMRRKAAELGEKIRLEKGVEAAVQRINEAF